MAQYFVTSLVPANADWYKLVLLLQNAGLPVVDVQTSEAFPGQVIVVTGSDLTQTQQDTMNTVVAQFDPRPRAPRPLYAIYNDLTALNATQQGKVWTDFSSGNPSKYLLDQGPNAAALAVLDWAIKQSGATGASLTAARFRAVSIYVQDNPKYLAVPAFDTSINILGDMPVG